MVLADDTSDVTEKHSYPVSEKQVDVHFFGTSLCRAFDHSTPHSLKCLASLRCADVIIEDEKRASLVVVAVVDVSGSMGGSKLEYLKSTLCFLASKLSENDQLAIVKYNGTSQTILPLTQMSSAGKAKATAVANHLRACGATNLCDGLIDGIRLIPQDVNENTVTSVLLMTDGQTNVGITSSTGILAKLDHTLKNYPKLSVNTFGYGAEHDSALLQAIAKSSEGTYFFIESGESVDGAFANCLGGLLSVVGQGVEIEITSNNEEIKIKKVHCKYRISEIPNGYRIHIGNIQAGEERDILFDVSVSAIAEAKEKEVVANLKLAYYDVTAEEMKEYSSIIVVQRPVASDITEEDTRADVLVDKHINRIAVSNAIQTATKFADLKDYKEATRLLTEVLEQVQNSVSKDEDLCVAMIAEVKNAIKTVERGNGYRNASAKLRSCSQSFMTQRSSSASLFLSATRDRVVFDSASFVMSRQASTESVSSIAPLKERTVNVLPSAMKSDGPQGAEIKEKKRVHFDSASFNL